MASVEIPGYHVLETIGNGAFALVYKASRLRDGSTELCAIKVFDPESTRFQHYPPQTLEGIQQRFLREANILSKHSLEHIVRYIDSGVVCLNNNGVEKNVLYIVMEYMEGGDLRSQLLRMDTRLRQPLEAALVIESLARDLHVLHQEKIYHRDISPGNILFGSDGRAKLADFGLALVVGESRVSVAFDMYPQGTRHFSAPELDGNSGSVADHRVDIFSLGSVLYFILTGHEPPSVSGIQSPVVEMLSPHSLPLPDDDLDYVISKCRRLDPNQRYQTVEELADNLRLFREGRAVVRDGFSSTRSDARASPIRDTLNQLRAVFDGQPRPRAYQAKAFSELAALAEAHNDLGVRATRLKRSLLFLAVEVGEFDEETSLEMARCLVDKMGGRLVGGQDRYGWTPLHLAVNLGTVGLVQLLLEKGADPDKPAAILNSGGTEVGGGATPLYEAAFCPKPEAARRIIPLLVKASERRGGFGRELVNKPSRDAFSPLMVSVWRRNTDTARFLLNNYENLDLSAKNEDGQTAFSLAVQAGDLQTVDLLLEKGYDRKCHSPKTDREVDDPIYKCITDGYTRDATTLIKDCIRNNRRHALQRRYGRYERTLLHQAAERGYYDIVELLCETEQGGGIALVWNNHGRTPRNLVPKDQRYNDLRDYLLDQECQELLSQ